LNFACSKLLLKLLFNNLSLHLLLSLASYGLIVDDQTSSDL